MVIRTIMEKGCTGGWIFAQGSGEVKPGAPWKAQQWHVRERNSCYWQRKVFRHPVPLCRKRKMKLARAIILLSSGLLVTACMPASRTPSSAGAHALAVSTLQRVNARAHQCWLKDAAFKPYGIVPELDTTGTPRLLVTPRGKPQALPKLVIAATGSDVSLYGPLSESSLGPRVRADVERWVKGGEGCA
ncbi:hypothetical protein [Pseudohoeflea coraliihabitans]|uniref:Lipoprotein n=1 Tax=Pseudohoeflea coraliihabitans TaxID=2860393 RepID=A0ABS6WUX4_9HYPH|nr:hypothetical protein [Pseudohoeflea sp. DP4N28-3]MBW3098834.1 hypothetical protein [Pseudohoeflea sp. DP4N28-3]